MLAGHEAFQTPGVCIPDCVPCFCLVAIILCLSSKSTLLT